MLRGNLIKMSFVKKCPECGGSNLLIQKEFKINRDKLLKSLVKYKHSQSEDNFKKILKLIN